MKPVDLGAAAPAVAQHAGAASRELGPQTDALRAALAQRLWQLLLAVPDIQLSGIPDQLLHVPVVDGAKGVRGAQALDAASSSTQGHMRERDGRDKDASSALASAAHMLALTIPQLGLMRYESSDADASSLQLSAAGPQQSWTVQLGHVDADGGNAAVNVLHPLLGDIALEVELSQGAVRVIATVPTDYGARILLEGQQVLAERLLRQGVTLQVLDVLVRRKRKGKEAQPARKRPRKEDR
jgi:hypothetical protein